MREGKKERERERERERGDLFKMGIERGRETGIERNKSGKNGHRERESAYCM